MSLGMVGETRWRSDGGAGVGALCRGGDGAFVGCTVGPVGLFEGLIFRLNLVFLDGFVLGRLVGSVLLCLLFLTFGGVVKGILVISIAFSSSSFRLLWSIVEFFELEMI